MMWCLIKHGDNVVFTYHNSALPFTVVCDILHTAVFIVNWSQSKEVTSCIGTGIIFEDENFSCLRYRTCDTVWVSLVVDCD